MSMKIIYKISLILLIAAIPALAQDAPNSNDIIVKMRTELNLQEDQITNITPIIQKYVIAFSDLQKSIDDNTVNPSTIDSQRQELAASEAQELSQYLNPSQISQMDLPALMGVKDKSDPDGNPDEEQYSNLPKNN